MTKKEKEALEARIIGLEARVKQLEQRPQVTWYPAYPQYPTTPYITWYSTSTGTSLSTTELTTA
jgi:hypothetical protein